MVVKSLLTVPATWVAKGPRNNGLYSYLVSEINFSTVSLVKECLPPTFGPISCMESKFARPPCNKLHVAKGMYFESIELL